VEEEVEGIRILSLKFKISFSSRTAAKMACYFARSDALRTQLTETGGFLNLKL